MVGPPAAGAATQDDLNDRLMAAYFTDGEDVGDPEVLVACAADCGLDPDEVGDALGQEDGVEALAIALRHATDLGITAVPTFVVDSRWSIPGAQDTDYFVRPAAPRGRVVKLGADQLAAPPGLAGEGPLVLVHGFTQTRASWADVAVALHRRRLRGDHRRRTRSRRVGRRCASTSAPAPTCSAEPEERRRTSATRWAGGWPCTSPCPDPTSSNGSSSSAPPPASTTTTSEQPDGPPTSDWRHRSSVTASPRFSTDWLALPLFANLPPDAARLDDRLGNTAAGLASSLRLAGTGAQQSLWPSLAVTGDAGAPRRR